MDTPMGILDIHGTKSTKNQTPLSCFASLFYNKAVFQIRVMATWSKKYHAGFWKIAWLQNNEAKKVGGVWFIMILAPCISSIFRELSFFTGRGVVCLWSLVTNFFWSPLCKRKKRNWSRKSWSEWVPSSEFFGQAYIAALRSSRPLDTFFLL